MKLALLAPISNSNYSKIVLSLAMREPGIEVVGVVVRSPFSIKRLRDEFRRDGVRLLEKVMNKLVLREPSHDKEDDPLLKKFKKQAKRENLRILCKKHQIPYLVTSDHNSKKALKFLKEINPDVITFTGGGLIRSEVLAIPKVGVLNCHSGVLPEFRGMDVVEWPIVKGSKIYIGLTVHFMDKGIDTGPILAHYYQRIRPEWTFTQIRKELEIHMPVLMLEGLRGLKDGSCSPSAQKPEDGNQYYIMHPRMKAYAEKWLDKSEWLRQRKQWYGD
jgi:methionyl-tRNA formyltransferase